MWMLAIMLACGPDAELEQTRAELEQVRAENSALTTKVAELERQLAETRPAFEAMRSLEEAAERTYDAPAERCVMDGDAFSFDGELSTLAALEIWARAARLLPVEEPPGLRLLSIRRDSLPASCGLLNGDILLSLNGESVRDPANWPKLGSGLTELVLQVERMGSAREIRIRGAAR